MAVDPRRQSHPRRRADRLGQDADRLPRRDRCAGARGCGAWWRARRRHLGGLCVATESAVERHPHQPGSAAGRHPRRTGKTRPARRGDPHCRAHRRYPAGRAQPAAQTAAAHPGDHPGIAVRAARLRLRPRDAWRYAHGDRRRDPCHRRQQARLASGVVAGTAGVAVPAAAVADWVVGDAEAHRADRRLFSRRSCTLSPAGRGLG